jgi:uncharacterized lipoprotein YddW (UPF0748 family)
MTVKRIFPIGIALAVFVLFARSAPAANLVQAFQFKDDGAAARAWTAQGGSPAVDALEGGGVSFPCPFTENRDRVYWDHDVSLDLSASSSFILDAACSKPEALRSLAVYFRSGDGWYIWNKPFGAPGRQRLILARSEFSVEGKPAGWNKIDRIRISPWKGAAIDTRLVVYGLSGRRDALFVVPGTLSAKDAGEKAAASRAAHRVANWLNNVGVTHATIDEKDVSQGALGSQGVAILPYNPNPPAAMISALRKFVKSGGRLVVCYSASPELATLMGVMLGPYTPSKEPGRWTSIVFDNAAGWHVPSRVYQTSWNIRPVYPKEGHGSVIAHWANAEGRTLKDPAWVATDAGAWMTHILLEDDTHNKQRMLVGIVGRYMPSALRDAAGAALGEAGQIDEFASFDAAVAGIDGMAAGTSSAEAVRKALARARQLHGRMRQLYDQGNYAAVLDTERAFQAALTEAYSLAQRPRPGEFRGVWDHDGVGWFPGNWAKTCDVLADSGMTAILPNVLWGGLAHFKSSVVPLSDSAARYGDQVEACVKAAHARGLKVHAWVVCWSLENAPDDFVARMKKEGRLQAKADGTTVPWLEPAHPANIAMALTALRELAQNYELDGIHLDYVRYPSAELSFSPVARRSFERALGSEVKRWPRDAQPGGDVDGDFRRWRARTITRFVAQAQDAVKQARPGIAFSAAVWGNYPDCVRSIGQDWATWLEEGYVDFVAPMNYTDDRGRFGLLLRNQLALPRAPGRVYPGIGVTAAESQLEPHQVIEQIRTLRKQGAPGFLLFDLSHTLLEETLPALKAGATAK